MRPVYAPWALVLVTLLGCAGLSPLREAPLARPCAQDGWPNPDRAPHPDLADLDARALIAKVYDAYGQGRPYEIADLPLSKGFRAVYNPWVAYGSDPVIDAQDFDAVKLLDVRRTGPIATVRIENLGQSTQIQWTFTQEGGAWRVDDVGPAGRALRAAMDNPTDCLH